MYLLKSFTSGKEYIDFVESTLWSVFASTLLWKVTNFYCWQYHFSNHLFYMVQTWWDDVIQSLISFWLSTGKRALSSFSGVVERMARSVSMTCSLFRPGWRYISESHAYEGDEVKIYQVWKRESKNESCTKPLPSGNTLQNCFLGKSEDDEAEHLSVLLAPEANTIERQTRPMEHLLCVNGSASWKRDKNV